MRTIRAIYNKAIKKNIVSEKYYPFKGFKIKTEPTIKRSLNKEHISALEKINLKDQPDLDFAKDIFLFSFYNRGMNFIDVFYLTKKEIQEGRIVYRRQKTGKPFSIKITHQAQSIIDKYQK